MFIREVYLNQTKGYTIGDSGWIESHTDDVGQLFRYCQQDYGRCTSKVYIDRPDGPPLAIGWVFEKRMKYEDARGNHPDRDYYVREVWVTLADRVEHQTTVEHHAIN